MPEKFLFALKLSGEPRLNAMLDDLARCVLEQIGYAPPAIADTLAKLRVALQEGADQGQRDCDVEFRAEAGQLLIVVSCAGSRELRVACPRPD